MSDICCRTHCNNTPAPNRKSCRRCLDRSIAYNKKQVTAGYSFYQITKNNGLCTSCGKVPPESGTMCASCHTRILGNAKNFRNRIKTILYDHYGRSCECCGENNLKFLSIDHINNDGNLQRLQFKGQEKLFTHVAKQIASGIAPTDLRVLCHNCNFGRQHNGGICPHKDLPN